MPGVKRRYDATARRAQAEQVTEKLLDTARAMLLRDGYAATTIPKLAQACGVSAESVYKRFAGKPGLIRAVVTRALQGAGSVPAETRSDALPPQDLASLLRGWAELTSEVAPRVAPILLLVRAGASHDHEMAELDRELDDDRRARMTRNARRIADAGHLPPTVTIERAGQILWTYSSPELYDLLVLRSGWTVQDYGGFIAAGLSAQLRSPANAHAHAH